MPFIASVISFMDGSFPSDILSGRGGKTSMVMGWSFSLFCVHEFVVEPRSSFTNLDPIPQQRGILVPNELLAPRFSAFQSHCTLAVHV